MSFDVGGVEGGVMAMSGPAAFYRLYAGRCVAIAHQMADPESKATLLNMAQAWLVLVDQAEKNQDITVVYETPDPDQFKRRPPSETQ